MKQKLKEYIVQKMSTQNKTFKDVSSFGLINSAQGQWSLKIYWKKKTIAGQKKEINIELDHDFQTMTIAATIMLELKFEASKTKMSFIEIENKLKTKKDTSGWKNLPTETL